MKKDNKKETPLWKSILFEKRLPWRYVWSGGFLNTSILKKLRLFYLPSFLKLYNLRKKEDIAIIIGVKNRFDYRIINALKSIRNQNYNQDLIKIILVDYDSKKELISKYKGLCEKYNAIYIRVNNKSLWNRSHCLNIGIKRAKTKYILTSDVDMIFERNYIKESIKELKKDLHQIILSNHFDSQKNNINQKTDIIRDYNKIKSKCKLRPTGLECISLSINLTLTYFYHKIRGYDEWYKLWGAEDTDLIKRFKLFGLKIKDISYKTSFLHQWHPEFEGVKNRNLKRQIEKNREYLRNNNLIVRNKEGWGKIN
ncbi:glycosyltransferase [Candidatus Woesearchaeota archaeon]|nr:glycosyltransferase [Candidatus Woesearchaeota archaeon]